MLLTKNVKPCFAFLPLTVTKVPWHNLIRLQKRSSQLGASRHRSIRSQHLSKAYSSGLEDQGPRTLSSSNNAYVKHCNRLRTNSKYRQEEGSALLAGLVPILELKQEVPSLKIKTLMWSGTPRALPTEFSSDTVLLVNDDILKKVSGLLSVKGLLAVAELGLPQEADFVQMPARKLTRLLVLDGVQDPGNLGTLMRSALALGWHGAFLLDGCCDAFNDKALRASRGAAFKLPFASGSWDKLRRILRHHEISCYAAEAKSMSGSGSCNNGATGLNVSNPQRMALILGAEGQGLSEEARSTSLPVKIPMSGRMESLCVSQAGAILLFLLGIGSPYSIEQLGGKIAPEDALVQASGSLEW